MIGVVYSVIGCEIDVAVHKEFFEIARIAIEWLGFSISLAGV